MDAACMDAEWRNIGARLAAVNCTLEDRIHKGRLTLNSIKQALSHTLRPRSPLHSKCAIRQMRNMRLDVVAVSDATLVGGFCLTASLLHVRWEEPEAIEMPHLLWLLHCGQSTLPLFSGLTDASAIDESNDVANDEGRRKGTAESSPDIGAVNSKFNTEKESKVVEIRIVTTESAPMTSHESDSTTSFTDVGTTTPIDPDSTTEPASGSPASSTDAETTTLALYNVRHNLRTTTRLFVTNCFGFIILTTHIRAHANLVLTSTNLNQIIENAPLSLECKFSIPKV
ncbi:hypothetical protein ECG_09804 [Echinococcus granulosus]|nr:hypothetical protein ECG_09804 [Echinococcus granulosus]